MTKYKQKRKFNKWELFIPIILLVLIAIVLVIANSNDSDDNTGGSPSNVQVKNVVSDVNNKTQTGSETQGHSFSKFTYDNNTVNLTANSDIASSISKALQGNPSNNGGTEEQDLESTDSLLNAMIQIQRKLDKMTGGHVSVKVSNSPQANEIFKDPSKYQSKILFGKEYSEFIKSHHANPNAESNNPSSKDVIANNNMQGNYNNPFW